MITSLIWLFDFVKEFYFLFFLRANYCNSNLTDFCATGKDMQIKLEEDSCGLPENVTKSFVEQIIVFRPSSDSYC